MNIFYSKRSQRLYMLQLIAFCLAAGFMRIDVAHAAEPVVPQIWMLDNNLGQGILPPDAEDVFLQPEQWSQAGKALDVYFFRWRELALNPLYTDDYLQNHLIPVLKQRNIAIGLEVYGALWAQATVANGKTRGEYYREQETELIQRIQSLGGEVEYINLLSVLSKQPPPDTWGNSEIYETVDSGSVTQRVMDIIEYVQDMKSKFPDIKIGELDSLIRFPEWRDGSGYYIAQSMFQEAGVHLDFWIVDLPYEIPQYTTWGITWADLVQAQNIVHDELNSPFGVVLASRISSSSSLPGPVIEPGETAASQTHINTLRFIDRFREAGGDPDIYFSNLYFPEPALLLPDSNPNIFSQMRTIKEIGNKLFSSGFTFSIRGSRRF